MRNTILWIAVAILFAVDAAMIQWMYMLYKAMSYVFNILLR